MSLLVHLDPGHAVTRATIGAVLQSSIVIVLFAVLARAAFRRRADVRHALWLGVLMWVLFSPVIAVLLQYSGFALGSVAVPLPVASTAGAADATIDTSAAAESGPVSEEFIAQHSTGEVEVARGSDMRPVEFKANVTSVRVVPRGSPVIGGLTLLWLAGILVGLVRIGLGWRRLAVLCRQAQPLELARFRAAVERARGLMTVAEMPPIVTSTSVRGPIVAGLLRPRVVLPAGLAESISDRSLCDMLVHECAHVVRGDAWVGLLQRVAGALFWPHPCIHYVNRQLARAREEVCDNHVLRCGDPCGYARTLLEMTPLCRSSAFTPAGIGLLATRWTLADRVAGLLDPRRIPMIRTSLVVKSALAVALAVTGLSVASIRVGRAVQAAEATHTLANPPQTAAPNSDFWNVEGTVVDEQGRPVGGALVRTMPVFDGPANIEVTTAADGTFRFTLKTVSPSGLVGLMAEADGGTRMGLDASFDRRHAGRSKDSGRIVLKPSRAVKVRVKDGAGAPVPGATVEAVETLFRTHATAGADGIATLRIPADAHVEWVLAFRPGAGLDYFENYEKAGSDASGPLPEEVILTLEAAPTVRIKTADSRGQGVAGVEIKPALLFATGKKGALNARICMTVHAVTDGEGIAVFDWFPKGVAGATRFSISPRAGYSCPDPLEYSPGGPAELKARVLRATRLGGSVRLPDGSPARHILVRANGWGSDASPPPMVVARTGENGRYELEVPPEQAYMLAVVDDIWAARSLKNVAVREGQAQDGLDFALIKGTVLRGQVTEEPGRRPCAGAMVMLLEQGGLLPKEFRGVLADKGELARGTVTTGADGRFQFRVGPGSYTVTSGRQLQRTESVKVDVTDEPEIARDLSLSMSPRDTTFKGVVIEKTATGERPIAKARVIISPLGPSTTADDQGRFEIRRKPGPVVIFAYSQEQGVGGFAVVSADEANAKLVISKGAKITGRIIDTDGKPQAKRRVGIRLSPQNDSTTRFGFNFMCDDQGRFTFACAPPASEGELSAPHMKDTRGRLTRARTVMPFDVDGLETVEVPDLVVPAEKSGREGAGRE